MGNSCCDDVMDVTAQRTGECSCQSRVLPAACYNLSGEIEMLLI